MSEPPNEQFVPYRLADLERRMNKLDDMHLEVLADRVQDMREEVHALRRAFYTFAFSVVGSAVIFALTFSFVGH